MANSVRLQCKLLQKVVKVFARQNGCPCPLCVRLVCLVWVENRCAVMMWQYKAWHRHGIWRGVITHNMYQNTLVQSGIVWRVIQVQYYYVQSLTSTHVWQNVVSNRISVVKCFSPVFSDMSIITYPLSSSSQRVPPFAASGSI